VFSGGPPIPVDLLLHSVALCEGAARQFEKRSRQAEEEGFDPVQEHHFMVRIG